MIAYANDKQIKMMFVQLGGKKTNELILSCTLLLLLKLQSIK